MDPRISIIMPVWNGEKYLVAAVESILAQTFTDFELIVVDDGSTDSTTAILASFAKDARLRVLNLDHGGIVSALNAGVAAARADWIARQDADDISHTTRLEKQWAALTANPDAIFCHTDVELTGEIGSATNARFPGTKALIALKLCFQCPIVHSTVLFRKDAFSKAGGYVQGERHAEDYALWGRMIELGDFTGVPERLLSFRMHAASVSRQNLETQTGLSNQIALEHCRRFMDLTPGEALRAFNTLSHAQGAPGIGDQLWFLTHCMPRLKWKSAEAFAWFVLRSIKIRMGIL